MIIYILLTPLMAKMQKNLFLHFYTKNLKSISSLTFSYNKSHAENVCKICKSPSFFVRVIDKSPLKNMQQDTRIRAENAVIIHKSRAKKSCIKCRAKQ